MDSGIPLLYISSVGSSANDAANVLLVVNVSQVNVILVGLLMLEIAN